MRVAVGSEAAERFGTGKLEQSMAPTPIPAAEDRADLRASVVVAPAFETSVREP